ncbi:MAG: hypothetical protein J1E39_01030 [Eubacterium sp.]|nr:hypothetical protein [Eubacterium sp.]
MLFLTNPFSKEVTEFEGEYFKVIREAEGKLYLSNGAIIKHINEGKYFDISTNEKYGSVYEAENINEVSFILGYALIEDSDAESDLLSF